MGSNQFSSLYIATTARDFNRCRCNQVTQCSNTHEWAIFGFGSHYTHQFSDRKFVSAQCEIENLFSHFNLKSIYREGIGYTDLY